MGLTPKTKEMLFILGQFFKETARKFNSAPLKISIPKAEFIDAVNSLGVVDKKGRAIYRNLESLQKSRFISYKDKCLALTRKGHTEYLKVYVELERYGFLLSTIHSGRIGFKRKTQTRLR